jgi:hypothetical protein
MSAGLREQIRDLKKKKRRSEGAALRERKKGALRAAVEDDGPSASGC